MSDEVKSQEYVLVFALNYLFRDQILMVHKDKPAWQAGRLNLPGGKVEPGETAIQAARRELTEETGLEFLLSSEKMVGVLEGTGCTIYIFTGIVDANRPIEPQEGNTEKAEWMYWLKLREDRRLIPNLQVIIPLCKEGVEAWVIRDRGNESERGNYRIEVIL